MKPLTSVNPATTESIATYNQHTDLEIDRKLDQVSRAYHAYRKTTFNARAQLLRRVADLLELRKQDYAELCTLEMGKTLSSAIAEVEKCAWVCRYYAQHGEAMLADQIVETDAQKSYVTYQPIGPVMAIMPWNYPLWQVFRYAAPTLMAGNACLLKHASNVTGVALDIEALMQEAGYDEGCFTTLLASGSRIEGLIADHRVAAVTLTGSGPAGRAVGAAAGRALKPSLLELGGSDPYIICADADLQQAAKACATSRLMNNGQSCIGAKRFVVEAAVYDEWLALFRKAMQEAVMGDPMLSDTSLGPLARADLRDEVHEQVRQSVDAGARLIIGGVIPQRTGAYYPPTILVDVAPGMPAYDDEIFGPVASVIKASDLNDAIRIANDTSLGLGAGIFTQDLERGEYIAKHQLEAGACFVNTFVKSDPRLPFGGIRESGYGRELSDLGIKAFMNCKTVWVAG